MILAYLALREFRYRGLFHPYPNLEAEGEVFCQALIEAPDPPEPAGLALQLSCNASFYWPRGGSAQAQPSFRGKGKRGMREGSRGEKTLSGQL